MLWGLSAFFVGLAMVYLVSVFYLRNKITREAQKIREKKKELSPIVSEFLFYDENGNKIEKINYIGLKIEVRELIKSPFDRKVLTEILMDLRKDVSGNTRTELFHIYQDLGLHEDAFKKLKSWRWEIIAKGIFELTRMHVAEAYRPITRFINDKRGTVRKQAEIAVVTLDKEGISYFLDNTKYKISEWQQLKLLDVVRNKVDYTAPPFRLWLTSKNNYVVLFALRLIKHYNQNDANASLITLVKHKSNHIKREAIHCIKEFYVTEALPILKQLFWKNNTDIKMHILDTIAEIGTDEDIPFLQSIAESNNTFMVKNKAVRAINTISPETILPTKDIEPLSDFIGSEEVLKEPVENEFDRKDRKELTEDLNKEGSQSTVQESQEENIEIEPKEVLDPITNPLEMDTSKKNEILEMEDSKEVESKTSEELTEAEIAFLPVVTASETEITTDNSSEESINHIKVLYEEVKASQTLVRFDVDFLPFVVQEQDEPIYNIVEFPVVYDVVLPVQEESLIDIDLQEVIYEEVNPVIEDSIQEVEPHDLLDFSELEVLVEEDLACSSIEEIENEQYIEWPLDFEVPTRNISNLPEEKFKNKETLNVFSMDFIIPKPKFHEELETIALLENIEELGDEREIPFLKSLLAKEKSPVVLEKIGNILDYLISNYKVQEETNKSVPEKEYSVFEELIFKGDFESKLFLLNEIAELGDAKELPLLHTLVSDGNKVIRETALQVLQVLQNRLEEVVSGLDRQDNDSSISIEELIKKDDPDFFTFNFEPTVITEKENNGLVTANFNSGTKGTLFDHLCNISTKFYNKKNG
ncbi:HEAT repeat domain-containing protein [Maribacter litopenaei]|uniref:HEAT repeat domain-containing protein n=1 Tax=Maribacter litopenaei TaxID=2976127 RepID=A0ABY5Y6J7_9FLAO|nr:HEAT repeat domain-containing protein [Maribacter litopenaei]UWX53611.1 HEAT repeat domain-containing protein [Maribacter litopenaei]